MATSWVLKKGMNEMVSVVDIGENLALNFDYGRELVEQYCTNNCQGYHRKWLERRKSEGPLSAPLITTPFLVSNILTAALLLRERNMRTIRVIIAGIADTKVLALVNAVFEDVGLYKNSSVEMVTIDACRTPLELCRRFSEGKKFHLVTVHGSMPDAIGTLCADLVVMSGVLQFMTRDAQRDTLSALTKAIGSDGMIAFGHSYGQKRAPRENARFGFEYSSQIKDLILDCGLDIVAEIDGKISLPVSDGERRVRSRYSALLKSIDVDPPLTIT